MQMYKQSPTYPFDIEQKQRKEQRETNTIKIQHRKRKIKYFSMFFYFVMAKVTIHEGGQIVRLSISQMFKMGMLRWGKTFIFIYIKINIF